MCVLEYLSRLRTLKWQTMEIRAEKAALDDVGLHFKAAFFELSMNAAGLREGHVLCEKVGLADLWHLAVCQGRGGGVSAELRKGMIYSERRVLEGYKQRVWDGVNEGS